MASIERLINAAQGDEIIAALDRIKDSENGRDGYDPEKLMLSIYIPNFGMTFTYSYNGQQVISTPVMSQNNVIFCDPDTDLSINMNPFNTSHKASCDTTFSWPSPDTDYVTSTAKQIMPKDTLRIHLPSTPGIGGFQINASNSYVNAWGVMAGTQIKMVTGLPTMTISFDANGGTGTAPEDMVMPIYSEFTTPENTFTRSGYAFAGWSFDPDAGVVDADYHEGHDNIPLSVAYDGTGTTQKLRSGANDITVYAIWTTATIVKLTASGSQSFTAASISVNGNIKCNVLYDRNPRTSTAIYVAHAGDVIHYTGQYFTESYERTCNVSANDIRPGSGLIAIQQSYQDVDITKTGVCSGWTFT